MKKVVVVSMVAFLVLSSCQGDLFSSKSAIEDAEAYFNANAPTLSLPVFGEGTKANGEEMLAYPEWKQAMSFEDGKVLEIPLRGPVSIAGEIVNYKGGKLMGCKSATRTSLIMDYRKADIPEMFVVTILEEGKKPKYHYVEDKTELNGFMIISELNGSIRSQYAYKYGNEYEMTIGGTQSEQAQAHCSHSDDVECWGFVCSYAVATKGDHNPGEQGGCYTEIVCMECPFCHYSFDLLLDINMPFPYNEIYCPACGLPVYGYIYLCPFCHERMCDCTCNPDDICPFCGMDKNMCNGCKDGYCECTQSDNPIIK